MDDKSGECIRRPEVKATDFEIIRKDEHFWQRAVKILAKNDISEAKNAENVSK